MIVLGLTGSIGMGKSTTAAFFRAEGIPVYDADAAVHALYRGEAVPLLALEFPNAIKDGAVNRGQLREDVLGKPDRLARLEAIIHPLVRQKERDFLEKARESGAALVVLDIPLLFETAGEKRCDAVLVVTATPEIQRARVLARQQMSQENFNAVLAKQMTDGEKRQRAHFIIDTGRGLEAAQRNVRAIIALLAGRA